MPTEQMSINERRTYLQMMLPHYTAANRFVQSQLLDVSHCVVAGGACQMPTLILLLTEIIGLSQEAAMGSVEEFGELAVQTHAMYCLWVMEQGKVHTPPAWYTASLKHNWNPPHGMPSDWFPTVLHFRVDETTFAQIEREMREEKTPTPDR